MKWGDFSSKPPSNTDLSTTWPGKTDEESEIPQPLRDQIQAFLERQHERRTMWRKRRGWETP